MREIKEVTVFIRKRCPYCKKAMRLLKRAAEEDGALAEVPVKFIDELEEPELADKFDYYYVPTFYVDGRKLHEGAPTFEAVCGVLREALDQK